MKKLLYLILIPILNFSQQTYIPDDNFEQALINFNMDPNPILDNYVPTSIISTIANLDISNKEINDLTGIEDFIYLDYLDCGENNLEDLNLANNTLLTFLSCEMNNLEELSIDNCTNLTHLRCNSNSLTTLNVSNNTQLLGLHCQNNNLECIEVSDVDFIMSQESDCDWQFQQDCFIKDEDAVWSLDCSFEASINESSTTKQLIKSFDVLGKDAKNTNFIIEIYNDGSIKKKFYYLDQ